MPRRTLEIAGLAVTCGAAVAVFVALPSYPVVDSIYHVVWADEIGQGRLPSFDAVLAPTEHPLHILLAVPAALGGDRVFVLETLLWGAALLFFTYRLGAALYGVAAGLVAAFLVAVCSDLVFLALLARVDVPFAAFVVAAAALEAERPRRGVLPMALLAASGLLRPEGWLLAGAYWLWLVPGSSRDLRVKLTALLVLGPLVWVTVDLVATGDPLFSRNQTAGVARELGDVPAGTQIRELPRALTNLTPWWVVAAGVAGATAAAAGRRRALVVPLALAATGLANYVLAAGTGLATEPRFLLLTAIGLSVLAGHAAALAGAWIASGPLGRSAAAGAAAAGVTLALVAMDEPIRASARGIEAATDSREDLEALLDRPRVRAALRCAPLALPTHWMAGDVRRILDLDAGQVLVRGERPGASASVRLLNPAEVRALQGFGVWFAPFNVPAPGATRIAANERFAAFSTCPDG